MSIISNIIDSDLRGFKVNDEIVVDKNVIGEFIKNSAKLTILNKNHQYDSLEKTYLNITNFGKWYVDNLNNNEESVEADLTLFDLSIKFDEDYEDTFSFPATLGEWANWIGNKVGVPLKGTFLNSDKQLTEKPYLGNNPKYRTAVKVIAKYASGWAEINEDETYSIKWFDDTTIHIEDWENFKHGSTTDPVNIIILSTGVTEDNIRYPEQIPTNAHELRIEDDWLAIDRYLISKSIFEQINGFSYTAITELTLPYGLLEFKVGQKIKTKDIELNEIESYISSHTLTWDGGAWNDPNSWTSTLKMDELKETTTKYQYSNSIESRVGKTEINCDKNNKKINMLVEDVDDIEQDITTSKQAQGNPIEVTDSGEYPLESIGIDEKSYQETTTGKNKFINIESATYAGITLTHNSDDSYDIVGTSTSTGNIFFQKDIAIEKAMLKDNTHYIISFSQEIDADKILIVSEFYGNGQYKRRLVSSTADYRIGLSNLTDVDTFRCYIMIKVGQTVNIKGLKIQVEEGQVATDIEPYTGGIPSPNPEYPQEIKTVQGITNLFDVNEYTLNNQIITCAGNLSIEDDELVLNCTGSDAYVGMVNASSGVDYTDQYGKLFEINNTIYSIMVTNPQFTKNYIQFWDKDKKSITPYQAWGGQPYITFTPPSNAKYATFRFGKFATVDGDELRTKVILVKGTMPERYVPKGRWLEQITIGKNKFDENYPVENYYYDLNGNRVANTTGYINQKYLPVNNKLSFSLSQKNGNAFIRLCEYKDNNTFIKRTLINSNTTITLSNETKYVIWSVDKSSSNYFVDLQIEEGEITPYEEYKENIALIDMNKDNLFDNSKMELGNSWNNAKNSKRSTLVIEYPVNEAYTLECNDFSNLNMVSIIETSNRSSFAFNKNFTQEFKFTHTMNPNAKYLCIQFQSDNDFTQEMLDNLKVKLYGGYDPYYEFVGMDEVKDEYLDGELTKKNEKFVSSSNDNWLLNSSATTTNNYYEFSLTMPNIKNNSKILCNRFKVGTSYSNSEEQIRTRNDKSIYININGSKLETKDVAGFKKWLSNNPIQIYYELEISQTYQLKYDPLKLFKGYNYITLNDDLYPNMNIKYLPDSKMNALYETKAEHRLENDKIISEVNGKFKDYSTTIETNAKIESAVSKEGARVELVASQKIDNIQIGGTNLVLDSKKERTIPLNGAIALNRIDVVPNEKIAISFYVKGASNYTGNIALIETYLNSATTDRTSHVWITGNVKTSYSRITYEFVVPYNIYSIDLGLRSSSNVLNTFKEIKIERGDKVTDWSPAPEDKLDNSKFTKAEIIAEINNGVSNVTIDADNINLNGSVTANNNFKILTDGSMAAKNGKFEGEISGSTIKGGVFKGTTQGVKLQIGTDPNGGKYSNNSLQLIKESDNSVVLSIFNQDFASVSNPLFFRTTSNHFTFFDGTVDVSELNAFEIFANEGIYSNSQPVITSHGIGNNSIKSIRMEYSPKTYLEIVAEGGAYGIDAWASDKRLKRRVKDSKYDALDTIRKIKHRQFIYRNTNEKVLIGYVADELQELDPNMVFEVGPQKIKQPNPSIIIPILSKAIQEQQEIIDKQDKRITELEDQVKKILKLVERESNGNN